MQIEIEKINSYGDGYGILNNKKVIIPKTAIGDIVECKALKENKNFINAELVKVIEYSKDRIDYNKICPIYDFCGGCNLLHLNDKSYYNFKKNIVENALKRANCNSIKSEDINIIHIGFNSRRRATLQVKNGKIGFFQKNTNNVIELNLCPLLDEKINKMIDNLKKLVQKITKITEISITSYENGVGLLFTLNTALNKEDNEILTNFSNIEKNIITISCKINNEYPALFIQKCLPQLTFNNGIKIDLPINVFLQATLKGQQEITNIVIDNLKYCKNVLDLYCGIGTYSFPLSTYTKVHAVEGIDVMVNIMNQNIISNKLNNKITAECKNLVEAPLLLNELNNYDGVVINPPRNGAKSQCQIIAKSNIKIVVMVSCNPQTFSTDAKELLENGYSMKKVVGIDQFYRTQHLEIVGVLTK